MIFSVDFATFTVDCDIYGRYRGIPEDTELPSRTNTNFLIKNIFYVDFKLKTNKRGFGIKLSLVDFFQNN